MADSWRIVRRGVAEPVVAPTPHYVEGVGGWRCDPAHTLYAGRKRSAVALWADARGIDWTAILAPGELSAAEQVAAERERCAVVAEGYGPSKRGDCDRYALDCYQIASAHIAARIRKGGGA